MVWQTFGSTTAKEQQSACELTDHAMYDACSSRPHLMAWHIGVVSGACQEGGFYCPDSASSLYYKGSASLNGTIKLSVCA